MEALDKPEVAYWSSFAGPGPRHEQKEQIRIHGVPADAMKKINESPTNVDLLAHYLFPWFDFWNSRLCHVLIWIACIIHPGSIGILQPTLIIIESTKMTRLFLDEMLVSVFVTGITQALFERFLLGDFAMDFLITICITIIVII